MWLMLLWQLAHCLKVASRNRRAVFLGGGAYGRLV